MHVTDEQAGPLKAWLVQKLDDISDAESDVLADYVLALIKTDEPDAELKQRCVTDLEEFLKDNTPRFVDEVIAAVNSASYDPKTAAAAAAAAHSTQAASGLQPIPSYDGSGYAPTSGTRKRSFHDDDTEMRDAGFRGGQRGDRQSKYVRRGGFEQRGQGYARGGMHPRPGEMPQMPGLDPNDPMSALLAMQAMISNMPGMEGMPNFNGMPGMPGMPDLKKRMTGKKCFDYENKGFCARGATCPYDHGGDQLVVGSGVDGAPSFAHNSQGQDRGRERERGRGRGRGRGDTRGGRGGSGGGRALFSSAAPNHDQSITSVVVENIPEEQCNEDAVRGFFGQFGGIEDITLQDGRRLAMIRYTDYNSAKSAYDSPKVIFDNRFVKVYWHKGENANGQARRPHQNGNGGGDVEMGQADPAADPAELARKQEEAQKVYEERKQKRQAAEAQRAELEAKLKAQEAERSALMAKLAAKTSNGSGNGTVDVPGAGTQGDISNNGTTPDAAARAKTEALKAKLAALEADARSMGINPNEVGPEYAGRGRGGFRGRVRGAWRGRGAPIARGGASVMRLDNRPKTINVVLPSGTKMGPEADEALKQFLLFVSQLSLLQGH